MTVTSSAQEITGVFLNRQNLLIDLARDTSNPQNLEAAENIAECITSDLTVNGSLLARDSLQYTLHAAVKYGDDFVPTTMKPEDITRHSDGLFAAQTSDNLYYDAYAIEGRVTDELGSNIVTEYYAWSPAEYQYTQMLSSPIDDAENSSHFGTKPPVVVDPSRAEAPVADF